MASKLRKKLLSLGLVMTLGVGVLAGCSGGGEESEAEKTGSGDKYKIGISQIMEHTALDSARAGFEKALEENGYKDKVEIDYQNAQGDQSVNDTIAQNFVSQGKDLMLGIATPSAQSLYNASKEIPILITAVTDPVDAGLVKSLEKPETNVSGTTDSMDIGVQFKLLKTLYPEAKKVGILYNTAEANSEVQVRDAEARAGEFGLEIVKAGVTGTNDVSQVLDSIIDEIDAVYVPTDNVVVSSLPLIYAKTMEKKMPIIASESGQVENGALATEGLDYEKLGYQTGLMAIRILEGEKPSEMPVESLKETTLTVNEDTLKKLGLELPKELEDRAVMIGSGSGE